MSLPLPDPAEAGLIAAARAYAQLGWHVVPFRADRKRAYRRYADEPLAPPSQVEEDFTRWRDALLCIRLPSNVVVLDLDPRDRPLDLIWSELTGKFVLPPGPVVRTPRGGLHAWFSLPTGIIARNWTSQHGRFPVPDIDIRTNGGLATLPPSRRSDGNYIWERWMPQIPAAPPTLIEALTPKPYPVFSLSNRDKKALRDRSGAYYDAIMRNELERVISAKPGGRNHALFVASARLGEFYADGLIPDIRSDLYHMATLNGLAQDDGSAAVMATIKSGWTCARKSKRGAVI